MQWMFMLIGLVLGWLLDESFSAALLGALLGLAIGQTIRIARLGSQMAEQQQQLEQAKGGVAGCRAASVFARRLALACSATATARRWNLSPSLS
jgi:hypothetical protein